MAKTKGADWNPRSLSSFSTFGSTSGPVFLNGQEEPEEELNYPTPNPLANGVEPPCVLPNGKGPNQSYNNVKMNINSVSSIKDSPNDEIKARVKQNSEKTVIMINGAAPAAKIDRLAPSAFGYSRIPSDDSISHYANSEIIMKQPLTRVAPPVAPRHSHSKSLIGEELIKMPAPSHGHSWSLVEDYPTTKENTLQGDIGGIVTLFLGGSDRRFGFSVVGGIDEDYVHRIDDIVKGSPADKADLEVGDEILEVNGKSLEEATHTEVISHIHQCIRSRTICLRVKRRSGNKLAADLAASSNVQDAFVIAVEQKARERLEKLSALKKIKPVDMTKLSSQLSEPPSESSSQQNNTSIPATAPSSSSSSSKKSHRRKDPREDLNGVPESSPIYVTSVPNLTTSSSASAAAAAAAAAKAPRPQSRSRSSTPHRTSSSSPQRGGTGGGGGRPSSPTSPGASPPRRCRSIGHSSSGRKSSSGRRSVSSSSSRCVSNGGHTRVTPEVDLDGNKSGDELELTHDLHEPLEDELEHTMGDSRSEDDLDDTCMSESGDSLPATPEKTYGIAFGNREVLLDPPPCQPPSERPRSPLHHTASLESKGSSSSRKSGGSGSSSSRGSGTPYKPSSGAHSRHSRNSRALPHTQESEGDNMISMVEFDPTKREMAVDVPDTFIGRTKTPPRYPPPKSQRGYGQQLSPTHNNNNINGNGGSGSRKGRSSPGPIAPLNGTLPMAVSPPRVPEVQKQQVVVQSPNSQEETNKLKRYEEEIKLRWEREEETAELLRTSIRDSQKLRALATYSEGGQPPPLSTPPTGVANAAFENEECRAEEDQQEKSDSPSINELIESLQRIQSVLKCNGHRISEDMTLVASLLTNPEFQKVLAVHNKVQETWCMNRPPTPILDSAEKLVSECLEALQETASSEAMELIDVLNKYSLEGLLYAHDRIAEREPPPEEDSPSDEQPPSLLQGEIAINDRVLNSYPEVNCKIVRIDKTNEALGATIRNEGDSVIIGRIVRGGAAEKSGLLHEGDEILEVNNIEVRGKSVNDVCDTLAGMLGTLTFIINPCPNPVPPAPPGPATQTMHVKAYFNYDPEEDLFIPCRELGMSFLKGDILHVMNQSDPNWWQAYRDGEEDHTLAGLIPSREFQQQREAMRQTVVCDSSNKEKTKKAKLLCAKKSQKKKKKKMLYPSYNDDYENEEILTYEEVGLYYPRANQKRPVVLIGPPNIGRHELRQKLMEDRQRFAAAVPHTSRAKKDQEINGQDYHFISRAEFEGDILARKFVEHGEYEKAYYGTSLDEIRRVVRSGKTCVLNLHPLALKMLKNSDLKPFVVLVATPSLEKLRLKKQKMGEQFKEEDLKETIHKAREMEEKYGHYFDLIIINQDLERTYASLVHEINVLEREPQWVPATWLSP